MSISSDSARILTLAKEIARGAGAILKHGFRQPLKVRYKGRIDPVTEYDLKSEKFILRAIKASFPDHSILAEESSSVDSRAAEGWRWVIDPLDGTVNYAHGFPVYCVSIGVEFEGELLVGVVFDPEREELFYARQGKGAFLNGQRIQVSTVKRLDRALLATGFAYDIASAKRNNLGLFARMAKQAQAIRRPGSAALDLCWLAAGRIDGFWELKLHPWDTAAGLTIISEAGGGYSRIDGREYSIFDPDLLASNRFLAKGMRELLSGS